MEKEQIIGFSLIGGLELWMVITILKNNRIHMEPSALISLIIVGILLVAIRLLK